MKARFQLAAGALTGLVLVAAGPTAGAGGLQPQGVEFPLTRGIPGDQINPAAALRLGGGLLVWQDAAADGDGLGISASRLVTDGSAAAGNVFQVNENGIGDQENPAAIGLESGGFFVAWQGGKQGFQRVYGRIVAADGTFKTGDIAISSGSGEQQIDPSLTQLKDGSVLVVWASYRQDGSSAYDAYGRLYSADGQALGAEFRLNQTQGLGRRSPAVAPAPGGGFVAVWVSERQSGVRDNTDSYGRAMAGVGAPTFEVNLVSRAFAAGGDPAGNEETVSEPGALASHPTLVPIGSDLFLAAWTRRDPVSDANHYDIACRTLSGAGVPVGPQRLVNNETYGDQYRPRLAPTPYGVVAVWTSMGQDGSWEGVFGRWISAAGVPVGDDIPINTQRGGSQLFPSIAADPDGGLLVAWSSNLPRTGFEVFAQRLAPLLLKVRPEARGSLRLEWPTVSGGVYQLQASRDGVTWSAVGGPRSAAGATDAQALAASSQMLLYRVVRVR